MESRNGKKRQKSLLANLLPTHEPSFQQGHVGDLNTKSKIELEDLLQRQEKLLSNKNFIAKLPDQGAKLTLFSSNLRRRLNEIEEAENINNLNTSKEEVKETESIQIDDEMFDKHEEKYGETSSQRFSETNLAIIEKGFDKLEIHEGPHYNVVKKAGDRPKKSKFTLNRQQEKHCSNRIANQINSSKKTLSQNFSNFSSEKDLSASHKNTNKQTSIPVLSSATIADPKKKTVVISLEECRDIHQKQQNLLMEPQSQHIAEQFMSKYGIKSSTSHVISANPESMFDSVEEDQKVSADEEEIASVTLDDMLDLEDVD